MDRQKKDPEQEPLAVLYLGGGPESDIAAVLSQQMGVVLTWMPGDDTQAISAVDFRPDVVVAAPSGDPVSVMVTAELWIQSLEFKARGPSPMMFLSLELFPSKVDEGKLYDMGYDGIVMGIPSPLELLRRSRHFLQYKSLSQRYSRGQNRLAQSFQYLDRFKQQLADTKAELIEDKTALNTALKQLQQMTEQRERAESHIKDLRRECGENTDAFVQMLSLLIQRRVEVNRGHGERVADIAVCLAQEMGFKGKILEDLQKAAMVHEMGLLFAHGPWNTPGGPSRYDQDLHLQYPVKGAEVLAQCKAFEGAAEVLRYLNENSDGTGYPEGLKRKNIPLVSRILAGADVFDTLGEDPDIKSLDALLEALGRMAGSRLDPGVVGRLENYAVLKSPDFSRQVRRIGVAQLEPGMELGTAIFTLSGTKLFSMGTVLTQEAIDKLIQYNREFPVDETVYIKA